MCDVTYPGAGPFIWSSIQNRNPSMALAKALLNLSPFGRSQVAEHLDWYGWFAHHDIFNLDSSGGRAW